MVRIPFVLIVRINRVTPAPEPDPASLAGRWRCLAAIVAAALLAALALASQLQPDPRGWGTHEQLGLPGCTFVSLVGVRCPACGMTTAWANVTHGRIVDAVRANGVGTLLVAVALATVAVSLNIAVRGRRLAWQPGESTIAGLAVGLVTLMLLEWAVRLLAR